MRYRAHFPFNEVDICLEKITHCTINRMKIYIRWRILGTTWVTLLLFIFMNTWNIWWCKIVCFMKISVHIWYSKKYQAYIQSIEKIAQPWNISLWFHAPLKWGSGTWQRGKGVLMCFVQESPLYSQPLPGRSCNFNSMVNDCINRKYKF